MAGISRVAALLLVIAACRGEQKKAPDRPPPPVAAARDAAVLAAPGSAALVPVPVGVASAVKLVKVVDGLDRPVAIVAAPGDARRRLFIVEQHAGTIRVLENGVLAKAPFATISGISTGNEQGLLGLAFHPQFATNGRLYVNYTTRDKATHIDEYRVSADGNAVDMTTKRELAVIAQPYSNHNGGHLEIGPDGRLYTGMGDGGAANDPQGNGQNPRALLGKLLRFDLDATSPAPEIVHRGLRNPWRFAFDRATGDLFIGDVGQNLWEYVHVVTHGDTRVHNFGWNIVEGTHCFDPDPGAGKAACDTSGLTLAVVEYPHEQGCSITGGRVYRGKAVTALTGRYFYADFCTGLLRSFVWQDGAVREHWDWKSAIDPEGVLAQVSSFGEDADGELYIVSLAGAIYRFAPGV